MKKIFIVLAALSFSAVSLAQTWAPLGATWTFGYQEAFFPFFGYHQWVSTKDTLVGGQNCKLLLKIGPPAVSDLSNKLITYEDSNRVYLYNTHLGQFTVLYDFNKTAGQSWTMTLDTCDLLITVDSTGVDTINGFPLKTLYLTSENWAFDGKVVQVLGHIWAPNPDITFHCYNLLVDGTYYTGLRCYEDSIIGQVDLNIAPDCYYTFSVDDIQTREMTISPNPFDEQTVIRTTTPLRNAELIVLSSLGQPIRRIGPISGNSITLTRGSLTGGVYFIRITQDGSLVAMRKVMILDR